MSDYAKKTWVNGVDATNQTNLNNIENGIAAIPGVYLLTTPTQFIFNDSITSGNLKTYTVAGFGTPVIPVGAKAALVTTSYVGGVAGSYLLMVAHGVTVSSAFLWPLLGQSQVTSGQVCSTAIVPLDASGKVDAIASGNLTSIQASAYGYIH